MIIEDLIALKKQHTIIDNNVKKQKDRINLSKGQIEEIKKQIEGETTQRDDAQEKQTLYQKTSIFCSSLLEKSQNSVGSTFDNIGSATVSKIFGDDKKLKFSFDKSQKKNPSVNIEISQPWENGEELTTDIIDAEGGAMTDIVALGLRLAMIKLITPEQKGPIFLDEICRYISKNNTIRATGEFLREIASRLDKQLIIITHSAELFPYADKLFTFEIGSNKTVIIEEQVHHHEKTES